MSDTKTKPSVYVRCSACGQVMFASEEVHDDVCPKCGRSGCMSERFIREGLPIGVTVEDLPAAPKPDATAGEIDRVATMICESAGECESGTFRMPFDIARYIATRLAKRPPASPSAAVTEGEIGSELVKNFATVLRAEDNAWLPARKANETIKQWLFDNRHKIYAALAKSPAPTIDAKCESCGKPANGRTLDEVPLCNDCAPKGER